MPSLSKLKFKQHIVSTVNDPISTKDLLKRLENLSDELSSTDQESAEIESYYAIKDQLINKKLLKHQNAGVQAYVCCCLSDILRLYAPDAPFTGPQLSEIFRAFFQQFKRLSVTENPYYQQQVYLLKRLAEVRSIILITDLADSESLIEQIFELFYELSNKNFPAKLEPLASDILSEIISESEAIPNKVLKLILNQFLSSSSSSSKSTNITSLTNITNPAFNFTIAICELNIDRMSRQVAQFFSEIFYENSKEQLQDPTDSDQESSDISTAKAIENLKKIHKLSIQVWKHVPELLGSVMGLMDDELNANVEKIRLLATETVGKIIAIRNSRVNFVVTHRETWLNWLKKTLDISPNVRCKWVEQTAAILDGRVDVVSELSSGLTKSLLDTDERVRLATCKSIEKIPHTIFIGKVANQYIMSTLGQLIRERHPDTRNEIIKISGELYNKCFDELYQGNEEFDKLVSWIPDHILGLVYINDININSVVDYCLFEKILPYESDTVKRVDRLLTVYQHLDNKAKNSFIAIAKRQQQLASVLSTFLEFCDKYNGGNVSPDEDEIQLYSKADKVFKWICVSFPEGFNSYDCIQRFYKLNNRRFYRLIKLCISPESDFETIKNSTKELLSKLSDPKQIKLDGEQNISTTDMVSNFKLLLYRSSINFFNKSNLSQIVSYSRNSKHGLCKVANEILQQISVLNPDVFKHHVRELTSIITNDNDITNKSTFLKIIYHFTKRFPELLSDEVDYIQSLQNFTEEGSPLEAKYAIKILSLSKSKELYTASIFSQVYPFDKGKKKFTTHLSTVGEIFLQDSGVVEPKAGEVTSFLIRDILLYNDVIGKDNDPDWVDSDHFEKGGDDSCYAKILGLRLFVNRLKSLEGNNDSIDVAEPVFKLLISLIGNGGEIVSQKSGTWPTPKHYQSVLRLEAGFNLLKLAKIPTYNNMIKSSSINRLVFLVQDQCEQVRLSFISRLKKHLNTESISEKFIPLIFFMAHEPNEVMKNDIKTWVKSSFKRGSQSSSRKDIKYERSMVRLLHMISHNQEFMDLIQEDMKDPKGDNLMKAYLYASEYLSFFLESIANQDNISLLYYFASRIKQYRDVTVEESDDTEKLPNNFYNIYKVAELAQLAIKELCELKNWTMQTWPGKLQLSADLFAPMRSTKEAQSIVSTVYIPDDIQNKLKVIIRRRLTISNGKKRIGGEPSKKSIKKVKIDSHNSSKTNTKSATAKKFQATKKPSSDKNIPKEPTRKSFRLRKNVKYADSDIDSESDENNDIGSEDGSEQSEDQESSEAE